MAEFSFIIPTYNRHHILNQTIVAIKNNYPDSEIIIVDDGSTDNTEEVVRRITWNNILYFKNNVNQGKGESLRKGFKVASGKYLIFTDDDLPYGIEGINLVVRALKEHHPVVIGERSVFYDNLVKKIGRLVFNHFFKVLLGIKIKDTQAGLKGFSKEIGKYLFSLSFTKRFAIDLEIIFLCQKLQYPIHFVPIKQTDTSPSKLSLFNMLAIALDIIKIKFHHYELV